MQGIREHSTGFQFKRTEDPPLRSDLGPYDFFLFGVMKENFSGQRFNSLDKLSIALETFLDALSMDIVQMVFQD
jgi:hypothetical protein